VSRVEQRRSTWVGIVVVAVFFAGVTLAVAMVGSGGPGIPHPADDDSAACVTCHPTDGLPDGHHDRVDDSCRSCHSEESAEAAHRSPAYAASARATRARAARTSWDSVARS
jgi:hypothetical protein